MHIVECIQLKQESENYKYNGKDIISGFGKLNIFVGKNNSGKSRFMRRVLEEKNYNSYTDTEIITETEINRSIAVFETRLKKKVGYMNSYHDEKSYFNGEYKGSLVNNFSSLGRLINYYKLYNDSEFIDEIKRFEKLYDIAKEINNKNEDLIKIYIPILRGLRGLTFDTLDFSQYLKGQENQAIIQKINKIDYCEIRTKKDYWSKEIPNKLEIITGLGFYEDIKKMLLGTHEEREIIRNYEKFLQEEIFEGKEITITPRIDSDVVYIRIDNEEKEIFNLGDGIQSIIILTFPMFLNKGKKVIFAIEEPELFLHPELQRKLIELMLDKGNNYGFESFQFFMTTHSNHFLDLILEEENISIFSFKKNNSEEFQILKENTETVVTLMDELGVKNSSVFLANCTIWVEGITDRLYIRKIFEVWQKSEKGKKEFRENIHFSFIEYSGGNITHWSFLDKEEKPMEWLQISNKILLISDSDGYKKNDGTEKGRRIKTLKENLRENFYCLEAKEMENTLSISIIKKIIQKYEGSDVKFNYEVENIDYSQLNIGEFINDLIVSPEKDYKDGNTIKNKVKFCKEAIINIKSIEDLSEEQKKICVKIYNFIEKSNG